MPLRVTVTEAFFNGWSIMASRLAVQLAMILLVTTLVFIAGYYGDHISLSAAGYAFGFVMAFVGGAVYLGLGQAIVGLIKNAETVNAVTRLVYFAFIMIGMFAEIGLLGEKIGNIAKWSPYGTVKTILATSMHPSTWNQQSSMALLVTVGYALVFSGLGIKWFRWSSK